MRRKKGELTGRSRQAEGKIKDSRARKRGKSGGGSENGTQSEGHEVIVIGSFLAIELASKSGITTRGSGGGRGEKKRGHRLFNKVQEL